MKLSILSPTFCFFVLAAFSISNTQAQEICPGADVLIHTEGITFTPDAIEIFPGTTVGWVNTGGLHDANGDISSIDGLSFNNPEAFDFELISVTDEAACIGTFLFTVPGLYNYDCSGYGHASAGMVATLTVVIVDEVDDLQTSENLVKLYPNPVSSLLTIENLNQSRITIYDLQGRVVVEFEGEETMCVDVSGFPNGVYTVAVDGTMQKLIVE
jgi:plastocyanin